jgi:polyferredoxin
MPYRSMADMVLIAHVGVVLFVVGGLVLTLVGNWRGWAWVNGWWFRLAHLLAIGVVVVQAWLGHECPLTTWESWLRVQAGGQGYGTSFVQHWLHRALFYEAPAWVFALAYSVFGALVLLVWWRFPPRRAERFGGPRATRQA